MVLSSTESKRSVLLITALILLVSSLVLLGCGGALMGFYRLHMLDVISTDFLIVPFTVTGGGLLGLTVSLLGLAALCREDSCLLFLQAILTSINILVLITGVICSVRLIITIQVNIPASSDNASDLLAQVGFLNAVVNDELSRYETESWVQYKWDTIQREFMCCGGYTAQQVSLKTVIRKLDKESLLVGAGLHGLEAHEDGGQR